MIAENAVKTRRFATPLWSRIVGLSLFSFLLGETLPLALREYFGKGTGIGQLETVAVGFILLGLVSSAISLARSIRSGTYTRN
jgi:hypothetical protein